MDGTIKTIQAKVYIEHTYPRYDIPELIGCRWEVISARREGNVAFAPDLVDDLKVTYCTIRKTWSAYHQGGYLILEAEHEGAVIDPIPLPPPKTRLQTRYYHERWEKYDKRKGWIAA